MKLTGKNPEDPAAWTKLDGPLFEGSDIAYGGGDCTPIYTSDSEIWFTYGAWDKEGGVRSCRAQKLDFKPDGTPSFPKPVAIGKPMPAPKDD